MKYDDLLRKHIGSVKNYQKKRVAVIAILPSIILIHSSLGSVFIAYEPDHHCQISAPAQSLNCSKEVIRNYFIPRHSDGNETEYNKCNIFARNYHNASHFNFCNESPDISVQRLDTVGCTDWEYYIEESRTSVVTEWDLVCDKKSLAKTTAGVYLVARIFRVFISG